MHSSSSSWISAKITLWCMGYESVFVYYTYCLSGKLTWDKIENKDYIPLVYGRRNFIETVCP